MTAREARAHVDSLTDAEYWRLHGQTIPYFSAPPSVALEGLKARLTGEQCGVWVGDNWAPAAQDIARLTAAVEAVLELADDLDEFTSSPEAHVARQFRAAIEKELTK